MADANKLIGSGAGAADKSSSFKNNSGPGRVLYSAVVEDFVSNPLTFPESSKERYGRGGDRQVQNVEQLGRMPRGSIIATVVSDQGAKASSRPVVCFPMFSHLNLPVKPGEQVWIMYQKVDQQAGFGFWISRRVGPATVDDPNYTHLDRVVDVKQGKDVPTSERFPGSSSSGEKRTFGSGGGKRKSEQTLPGGSPYKSIIDNSSSNTQFTGEVVPNFSSRCSDLSLLGSNNTRIVLGEDRTGSIDNDPSVTGMGTIDIVAGTGQAGSGNEDISIENTRGYSEADRLSTSQSQSEGDPDFITDLSRLYISMKTNGDTNFEINTPSIGITDGSDSGEGPYAVMKSTHPRIIAKNDGSIKIVHESGSSIVMDSSGNVSVVTNGMISMGTSANNLEPFVRGDTLKNALDDFANALSSLVVLTPAGPSSVLGSGLTNPATSMGTFSLDVTSFKSAVASSLSQIIEGE